MKKIISLLIIAVIGCIFVGCGNSSTEDNKDEQFTVICNDGTVEKMSLETLKGLSSNELEYSQKYKGAHVSGKGEIVRVEKQSWKSDGTITSVRLYLKSGLELRGVPAEYASNYGIGDIIDVSGTISFGITKTILADSYYN